jgi:type IV secretory pathway VirB10-like protein
MTHDIMKSGVSIMRKSFSAAVSLAILGLFISSPVFAQTKTAKVCKEEWKANKADNQAKGITEKAYVTQCRAGTTAAAPTTPPATTTAAPPPKQDTATKPAPMPAVATPAAKQPPTPKPMPTATTAPAGNTEFSTEAQAKGHCPSDTVVWANLKSKIYHFAATKTYGTTKNGTYMCEKESMAGGFRAAKNEKHP